jgi:hypothetical protein
VLGRRDNVGAMARTFKYALERKGLKRLAIKRRWFWRDTEVSLDGTPLGPPIPAMDALRAGQDFPMPDGRRLRVGFEKKLASAGLALTVDGRPVPGAINDRRTTIRSAGKLLFFLAALNILIGALVFAASERLRGLGYVTGGFGVALLALGVGVYVYRSRVALMLAIILEIVDGIAITGFASGGRPPVGAIVIRFSWRAVPALRAPAPAVR